MKQIKQQNQSSSQEKNERKEFGVDQKENTI